MTDKTPADEPRKRPPALPREERQRRRDPFLTPAPADEPQDREPQPEDGPDYHADHQAWRERQADEPQVHRGYSVRHIAGDPQWCHPDVCPEADEPQGRWTVTGDEPGSIGPFFWRDGHLVPTEEVLDALNARPAPPPTAEQWIITAGTNIHSPVGPFASEEGAEDYYKANQPRGGTWLAKPAIVRLLRPAAVEALSRTTEDGDDG